jgi:hypothetical protein
MKLFNSLCKAINMNVNKWKRKERNRKKRKGESLKENKII